MENNEYIVSLEKAYKDKEAYLKRGLELKEQTLNQQIELLKLKLDLVSATTLPYQSTEIDKLNAAFVKARLDMPEIPMNGKVEAGAKRYTHAVLEDILTLVVPPLSHHGLYVDFYTDSLDVLHTLLRHESGQWRGSRVQLIPKHKLQGNPDQQYGTQMTYQRRYQLCSVLGIQPGGEDTDGNHQDNKK